MKRSALLATAILLGGCTSTLEPKKVGERGYYEVKPPEDACSTLSASTAQQQEQKAAFAGGAGSSASGGISISDVGSADAGSTLHLLKQTVCDLRKKQYNTLRESRSFENSGAWRDLPIIGGVAAIAGLVLFGERNAEGNLKGGEIDVIEGIGLGSGTLTALSGYLKPENARKVLREASAGYGCMAMHGDVLLQEQPVITDKAAQAAALATALEGLQEESTNLAQGAKQLRDNMTKLRGRALSDASATLAETELKLNKAQTTFQKGVAAYEAFKKQERRLRGANTYLHNAAFNFGAALLSRTDRDPVDVDKLVASIQQQQKSMLNFEQLKASPTDPSGTAPIAGDTAAEVRRLSDLLLIDLANIDALVLGFDTCASSALAGAKLPIPEVQLVRLQ